MTAQAEQAAGSKRRRIQRVTLPLALAVAIALAIWPSSGSALVVRDTAKKRGEFSGAGCGSIDTVKVGLPRSATRIRPKQPRVGAVFYDFFYGTPVARLTAVNVSSSSVRFVAEGSDDTCTDPGFYEGVGWDTDTVRFRVRYRAKEKVYVKFSAKRQYRPKTMYLGASGRIIKLRWRGWNQPRARARGVLPFNNCRPYCAVGRITNYPIKVKVSKPRDCGKHWRYTRLRYRYLGRSPTGRQTFKTRASCAF